MRLTSQYFPGSFFLLLKNGYDTAFITVSRDFTWWLWVFTHHWEQMSNFINQFSQGSGTYHFESHRLTECSGSSDEPDLHSPWEGHCLLSPHLQTRLLERCVKTSYPWTLRQKVCWVTQLSPCPLLLACLVLGGISPLGLSFSDWYAFRCISCSLKPLTSPVPVGLCPAWLHPTQLSIIPILLPGYQSLQGLHFHCLCIFFFLFNVTSRFSLANIFLTFPSWLPAPGDEELLCTKESYLTDLPSLLCSLILEDNFPGFFFFWPSPWRGGSCLS